MARYTVSIEERVVRTRTLDVVAKGKMHAREIAMEAYEHDPEIAIAVDEEIGTVKATDVRDRDLPVGDTE